MRENPKSLGLKDGSVVAFAFTSEEKKGEDIFYVETVNMDELYPEEE